jgi:malonyl CoA-acyl carrier protein transacylase
MTALVFPGQGSQKQPALFVVNALHGLEWRERAGRDPDGAAGHSLGEYDALFAAGAFGFEAGGGWCASAAR